MRWRERITLAILPSLLTARSRVLIIGELFMVAFLLACIAVGAWVIRRVSRTWTDPWRIAAYLTLAPAVIDAAMIAIGTARDPTSHNLWPFELLMAGGGGAIALGVLTVVRPIVRPQV